jgi:subtilase family serine protease
MASRAGPTGYAPQDLRAAYGLNVAAAVGGVGRTVAIVDPYDDPNAAADLATYRAFYKLPACTAASGCFRKVGQSGGSSLPVASASWAAEISLDLDMASAICANCRILLVEANSAALTDLVAAEDYGTAHANVVSNSWGRPEFSGERAYDAHFSRPTPVVFSSGDSGYGVQYPAASPYVTAVGGTTLTRALTPRGFSETAWSGSGSGCSAYEPKPAWQHDKGCAGRAIADVSADGNTSTGVSVYDSYRFAGWLKLGGSSAAAPIIAGTYAVSGALVAPAGAFASLAYANSPALFDVVGGTTGSCGTAYLCTAVAGYDSPTGLGSPNGVGAF